VEKPRYNDRKQVEALLERRGLSLKKRFGQNFLIDENVRRRVAEAVTPAAGGEIWEIGPGIGALTELLRPKAERLILFEIDHGFADFLEEIYPPETGIEIVRGDFLKTGVPLLEAGNVPRTITGNLPYSSGSAMVYKILEVGGIPETMVFTLQREVADRMIARPGSKNYSQLSLVCSFSVDIEKLFDIGWASFYPVPSVTSSVVRMRRHDRYTFVPDRSVFFQASKDLFRARRKTVKNNLSGGILTSRYGVERVLACAEDAGISLSDRGENLPVETVALFAARLTQV
jgi:16S rRNA (adenine1518-N6/adenine1519-N6)-dimethyltransferase